MKPKLCEPVYLFMLFYIAEQITFCDLLRSTLGERNHNLAQAEKISILWLIQIDAILDFSEGVWVWVVSANTACKLPMKLHNILLFDCLFVLTVFTQD